MPPSFENGLWSFESFSTGDPRLWALYEIWLLNQGAAGEIPVWDIDLIPRLAPWLPDMFEVKLSEIGPRRFSRFGSGLARAMGVDLMGRDLASRLFGPGSERIDADALRCRASSQALWSDDELHRRGAPPVSCERLLLPFSDTLGKPSRLVGCLYLRGTNLTPGWLGTITRFVNLRTTALD